MARRRSAVVLALVCVLAVSVAAATLPAPTDPRGEGTGSGDDSPQAGPGAQATENTSSGVVRNAEEAGGGGTLPLTGVCVAYLTSPAFFALAAVAAGGAALAIRRRVGTTPAVLVVGGLVLSASPLWFVATDCRSSVSPEHSAVDELVFAPGAVGGSGGGEAAAEAATNLVTEPLVLLGVAAVVVGLVAVAYHASGDDRTRARDDANDGDDDTAAADSGVNAELSVAAAAAGEAADRIEAGADADNEVYRAWREMAAGTDLPNPDAATPEEFARAARDAGMPTEDVAALTAVFREVRYGGADPTADRERRAVDALRGVQAAADPDAVDGWDNE